MIRFDHVSARLPHYASLRVTCEGHRLHRQHHPEDTENPWVDLGIVRHLSKKGVNFLCHPQGIFRDNAWLYCVSDVATEAEQSSTSSHLFEVSGKVYMYAPKASNSRKKLGKQGRRLLHLRDSRTRTGPRQRKGAKTLHGAAVLSHEFAAWSLHRSLRHLYGKHPCF